MGNQAESERRQATIVFADISGFTSMSEKLEPEEVTDLMNACFDAIGSIATERGGMIDKFIGDCAMLVFGVPTALERASEKALHAALEIREAIERINRERQPPVPIAIHIGINTGTVVAGNVGSSGKQSYTVMGDPVNLASRLKDIAKTGTILVGRETWADTRREFDFGTTTMIKVKGKEQPVEARELLGRAEERRGAGRIEAERLSPLVGRGEELRSLVVQVLQAQEGRGSIVLLSGEPGIGKSRLVSEFLATIAAKGCLQLEGRCYSLGRNLPFHPFVDLLRKWAAIREEDGDTVSLSKLESAIAAVAHDDADIYPFVARMMGLAPTGTAAERLAGIEGEALDNLVGKSARDLFSRLSDRQPLLVVIEDLHWADESTLGLLGSLLSFAETKRICFLLTTRPDYTETSEQLRALIRKHYSACLEEIDLTPLGREDSGKLLDEIMETSGISSRLRERIIDRADGNPYFIEEVLRSLIDDGSIVRGAAGWELVSGLDERPMPSTIQEVLMARIDHLDEKTRSLIRIASVIGRSFSYRVLTEVAQSIDEIEGKILHLTELQLLLKGQRLEEIEYLFKHALAQEVAYESILINKRRELHKAVAEAIRRLFADRIGEFAGMLAWHYVRAEDFDRAEEYMIKAGEEAMKSAASSEALSYYQDAFGLYKRKKGKGADPAKVAEFETNIARALYSKGNFEEALPHYNLVLSFLAEKVPGARTPRKLGAALGFASLLVWIFGPGTGRRPPLPDAVRDYITLDYEKAQMLVVINASEAMVEGFALFRILLRFEITGFDTALVMLVSGASACAYQGISLLLCKRWLARLGVLLDNPSPAIALAFYLSKTGYDYCFGAWDRPGAYAEPIVMEGIKHGNLFFVCTLLFNECLGFIERGDWAKYEADTIMLGDIAKRFGNESARLDYVHVEARRLIKQRRNTEMLAAIPEYMAIISASGLKHESIPNMLTFSARSALCTGDLEKAEADYSQAIKLEPGPKGSPWREGLFKGARAAIAVERIRHAQQERKARFSLVPACEHEGFIAARAFLASTKNFAPNRTEALKIMGSCHWLAGHRRQALRYWRRSILEGERLGAKVELAHTLHDAGELLGTTAPGPGWLRRAAELYRELAIEV